MLPNVTFLIQQHEQTGNIDICINHMLDPLIKGATLREVGKFILWLQKCLVILQPLWYVRRKNTDRERQTEKMLEDSELYFWNG